MKKKNGVKFYDHQWVCMKLLPDNELACLVRAIMEYAQYGTAPALPTKAALIWPIIRSQIDEGAEMKSIYGLFREAALE